MSIRLKIFIGCLSLALVTVALGAFMMRSHKELAGIATRIYDDAFMAVSYMRASQNGLLKLKAAFAEFDVADRGGSSSSGEAMALLDKSIPDILADIWIAQERAMSEAGAAAVDEITDELRRLDHSGEARVGALLDQLDALEAKFDTAVEIYAGDGYRYRRRVGELLEQSKNHMRLGIGFSLVIATVIAFGLSRSIVPAIRRVVNLARSIAAGQLDNAIDIGGSVETAQMSCALASMQTSIKDNLVQIRTLMEQQTTHHESEVAQQHRRFEAALNNMTQGLSMFDAADRLMVFNRRFAEMFGAPEVGAHLDDMTTDEDLRPLLGRTADAVLTRELKDGRVIAASRQPIEGGGWVATYEDVTERRKHEERLAQMARHDALTGLPNRLLFRERLAAALVGPGRTKVAVMSLDLDGFKTVNDGFGHAAGDVLLAEIARRLEAELPNGDLVARLGADELCVISGGWADADDVAALAVRLVEAIKAPFVLGSHSAMVEANVGIATVADIEDLPGGADEAEALLKYADLALHRAKTDGRGTFRFFEAEMDRKLQARRSLEEDFRTALARNELELFYQPLINTEHRGVTGFEALIRWRHPERGLVSPGLFVPLAEDMGLIKPIGAWVLQRACADATRWPSHVRVAVNLSPTQFANNDLVGDVAGALRVSGLPPERLELEITESVLLQDDSAVLATLTSLHRLGVRIAMDDFGTGYSSLSYLQRFPFDKLKIDQSFVRDISSNEDSVTIVRAVIGLGRSLGMAVIAEGVETGEQLAILEAEGCFDVQGYLFSPPAPRGEVEAILARFADAPSVRPRLARAAAS